MTPNPFEERWYTEAELLDDGDYVVLDGGRPVLEVYAEEGPPDSEETGDPQAHARAVFVAAAPDMARALIVAWVALRVNKDAQREAAMAHIMAVLTKAGMRPPQKETTND